MSTRVYYIRDQINIRTKQNGKPTKGNPVVCIVSEFNPETKELKYGYAAVHPNEGVFMKSRAREIASARLQKKAIIVNNIEAKNNHELNKAAISNLASLADKFSKPRFIELANFWMEESTKGDIKRQSSSEEGSTASL